MEDRIEKRESTVQNTHLSHPVSFSGQGSGCSLLTSNSSAWRPSTAWSTLAKVDKETSDIFEIPEALLPKQLSVAFQSSRSTKNTKTSLAKLSVSMKRF